MRGWCRSDEYDCSTGWCNPSRHGSPFRPFLGRCSEIQEMDKFPQPHKVKHAMHFWKSQSHLGHHKFGHNSLGPKLGQGYHHQARRHHGLRFRHFIEEHRECEQAAAKSRKEQENQKQEKSFPEFLKRVIKSQNQLRQKKELNPENAITYEPKSKVHVTRDDSVFKISLDTSHYQPDEIKVKIVKEKIDISAIHESIDQDLYEFHEMYRSFSLPEDVDSITVVSHLDSNGKLTVKAPIQTEGETTSERDVPIFCTNN